MQSTFLKSNNEAEFVIDLLTIYLQKKSCSREIVCISYLRYSDKKFNYDALENFSLPYSLQFQVCTYNLTSCMNFRSLP